MRVSTRCEHRTTEADLPDGLPTHMVGGFVRALILACPTCSRLADGDLEEHERLSIIRERP